ncbi:MAG: hypothetical protein FJ147_07405 [Deltaproteobacteria bacterium]|nr:hypothetical protein [Deltaproteobacteria bacterium]
MNQLIGLGLTAISVFSAAIVTGFRLKPYMDAGVTRTPPTFAIYPAAIALAITIPVVFFLRWKQGSKHVEIGPAKFMDSSLFIVMGCLLYILVAVSFFPYQPMTRSPAHQTDPHTTPSSGGSVSIF